MASREKSKENQTLASDSDEAVADETSVASAEQRPEKKSAPEPSERPVSAGSPPELGAEQLRKMAAAAKSLTAALGEIVALLMRSPQHKHYSLADLEWLVVPALLTGQFSLVTAQSRRNGLTSPVGLIVWASVSDEVDQRLSAAPGEPLRLEPHEWKSGSNPWVVLAIGDKNIMHGMMKELQTKTWTNKPAKLLVLDNDNEPRVATIAIKAA